MFTVHLCLLYNVCRMSFLIILLPFYHEDWYAIYKETKPITTLDFI